MRCELQNGAELDHGLRQVDEVAASVFEENGDDGANVFWFAAEPDAEGFKAVVFGVGELVLANGVHLDHEGCNYS
jgi:hypothetical protein